MNRHWRMPLWLQPTSLPRDITPPVLGFIAGWAMTHVYYVKSLESSRADVAELRRLHQLTLLGIESIGAIHYARDSSGTITGVNIQLHGSAAAGASASGTL